MDSDDEALTTVLPGKQYTPEEIVRIALRRAWLILLTLGVGAGMAAAVSKYLPNKFRSETLIMLIPQRIPQTYVKGAITANIEDRLNSLQDQILSRSRLERIILDLDLYGALRRKLPMEDVVLRMRDDIVFKTEGKESFRVSYVSQEAITAQKTAERLASLFIEENMRDRENVAEDTNQFLNAQLEDAKRRLLEHEKKLEEYRTRYGAELPTQVASNLQAIQNAQVQLRNLADAADRARERRLNFERQIADLEAELIPTPTPQATTSGQETPLGESTAQQLQAAQAKLTQLLEHKTLDHPDVRAMQRTIRNLQTKLATEEAKRPPDTSVGVLSNLPPAERQRQQRIRDLKIQIDDIDRQLKEKQEEDQRLRGIVAEYQAKLDAAPKRESELVELTRDYTTLEASYRSLLEKREEAKLAANLERRDIGEQFRVLDPAKVPERPFSPNRILINAAGAGGGLALGVLLVVLLEYLDSSLKNENDVVRVLNVRVLAQVPLINAGTERAGRKWWVALWTAGAVAGVASAAAVVLWRLRL
jgi:polysaccharide chain length determinant protein (PEP-CTERM system associated)